MRARAILIPAIMLGAITCAHAQDGPAGRFGGGPDGGGPSMGAPGGGGGPAPDRGPSIGGGGAPAEGPGDAGPGGDGPRAVERLAPQAEPPAARSSRNDGDGPAERGAGRKSAGADRGDDGPKIRRGRSADDDGGPSKPEKAADRAKAKTEEKAEDVQKRATDESKERGREARDAAKGDDAARSTDDAARKGEDGAKKSANTARVAPEKAKQVEIASDKRDRVESAFRDRQDVRHRTNVDISIGVGRRLPRDWDYVPVPIAVVEIVPEYRDYVYVWVEDEYVICDPDTFEVVAIIPAASSSRHASSGGVAKCTTRIRLSDDERELILQEVRMRDAIEVQDLNIGWSVPANIELQRFPEPVLAEADELSGCRYFVAEDQLAVVDPEEDKVVLLIDRS